MRLNMVMAGLNAEEARVTTRGITWVRTFVAAIEDRGCSCFTCDRVDDVARCTFGDNTTICLRSFHSLQTLHQPNNQSTTVTTLKCPVLKSA